MLANLWWVKSQQFLISKIRYGINKRNKSINKIILAFRSVGWCYVTSCVGIDINDDHGVYNCGFGGITKRVLPIASIGYI